MSDLKVKLTLNDVQAEDKQPNIALFLIENGKPTEKISTAKDAEIEIPSSLTEKATTIAFGPDVDNLEELDTDSLLQFNSLQIIPELEKNPVLDIPELRWRPWLSVKVCVSGKAQKCFFPFFPRPIPTPIPIGNLGLTAINPANLAAKNVLDVLRPPVLQRCLPLCHGVVEVYERTCCCNIWDIIPRIPDLIPELVIPEKLPIPDPPPIFTDIIRPTINIPQNILRSQTVTKPIESVTSVNLDARTMDDLKMLLSINSEERQVEFIEQRPYLIPVLCRSMSCSVKKVGETNIGKDGKFSLCYHKPFTLTLPIRRCYTSYFYRVRQWIGGSYVYIYEGAMSKQYFNRDEEANLTTFHAAAETCEAYEPPVEGQGKAYVMLQNIGSTDSYKLNSPLQTSATGINTSLGDNGGLLNFGSVEDCPLAKTLNLRLYIDPDLEATDVTYYRLSIVKANSNGTPDGIPVILNQPVAWRKFNDDFFPPKIEAEVLGPLLVNNTEGLYKIPYINSDNEWLGGQFHYALNTLTQTEGTHLLILELFDENGDQVKPQSAVGTGTEKDFHFLKWKDAENTDNVPFAALIHTIQINNTPCVGTIEDLRKNSTPNTEDCQFMTSDDGTGVAQFSAGFRAYQEDGFMHNYALNYRRGLSGVGGNIEIGTDNVPDTLGAGNPAESEQRAFSEMLGTTDVGAKCTFTLNLHVNARHTNGSGFIDQYDARDQASFALEITPTPMTT